MKDQRKDRRKDQRIKALNRIAVICLPEQQNDAAGFESNWHTTIDISRSGLRYRTSQSIQSDSFIRIDLVRRSRSESITLIGLIKWVSRLTDEEESFEVGVELLDSGDGNKASWQQYVDTRLHEAV